MKKWLTCLFIFACLMIGQTVWAQPQIPPKPTDSIYVQDFAGVMSDDTKARLNSVGSQLAAKTKAQVVVVTVKSLDGYPVSDYALEILRQWGVGDKQLNNGVVILVAPNDRQSRIEVGYGLEGRLPDAKTGRIQDDYMIPYFKANNYEQGIYNGYMVVVTEVAKEYNLEVKSDAQASSHTRPEASQTRASSTPWWVKLLIATGVIILLIIDWVFLGGFITMIILSLFRGRGGGGGGGFGGGGDYGGGSGGGGGSSRGW